MPFVEIPPENLVHLPLFGYDKLADGDDDRFEWYATPRGRMMIDKRRPFVWVDDPVDAIQLGAIGIIAGPAD